MSFQTNFSLDSLNDRQRQGVLHTEGPLLVIAGAGSGKTKMLTSRIVHLIRDLSVAPHHILAVTFTNKAAAEMRHRVGQALGQHEDVWKNPPPVWMDAAFTGQPLIGTFHSVCMRILRKEGQYLPFTAPFQILDDSDQLTLIKDCFKKLNLNDKTFSPKSFQHSINQAKCSCLEPNQIVVDEYDIYTKNLVKVYELYQQEMFKSNSVDFGEIITLTYKVLRDNPEALVRYQNTFRYIHVDEYQDTNRAQYLLIRILASSHRNLCVVGDEDQSIYKWRGADIRNILDFEKDYSDAKIVKLEQNYRSTQTIINASSQVISHNTARKKKTLWTSNERGELIVRVQLSDDHQEANFVVKTLKQHCEQRFSYNGVAIFYRTNAQSRIFEDVLRREKVPYTIVGGLKFYDRKEIKDVLAYFRVLSNESDSVGLKRIINVPQRGIGKTTIDKIEAIQFQKELTFSLAAREAIRTDVITGAAAKKVRDFFAMIENLRALMDTKTLSEFYHELIDRTGYVNELRLEGTEESLARIENLQEFNSIIADFEEQQKQASQITTQTQELNCRHLLNPFLESVSLASEQVTEGESSSGVVSLMTLHTSKGLEFPLVFMVGMEEGLFPSIRGDDEEEEAIEEERRLCYVGMTRAKELLYMSHAQCRRVYGNIMYHEPARFFNEIPNEFVEVQNLVKQSKGTFSRSSSSEDDSYDFDFDQRPERSVQISTNVGRKVRHGTYGVGVIKNQEGNVEIKVTVEFSGRLIKKFILKYAQLEFLS